METLFKLPGSNSTPSTTAERLLTLRKAADAVGAKYWHIQRAARAGHFPVYRPYNTRPLVKLSEVVAYIDSCRQGGAE